MSETHITHGIYCGKTILTRESFFKGYEIRKFEVETELQETLKRKMKSWKNKVEYIEFTYGYNDKYAVLTLVSPKDQFNRKIGYQITLGRLKNAEKVLERCYRLIDGYIQVVGREVDEE